MILVKTRVGLSAIHGTGLFADELIPRGTVVWRFVSGFDRSIPRGLYDLLPPEERADWERYGYVSRLTGAVVRAGDGYVYMNHSHEPNVGVAPRFEPPEGCDVALRDILPGEELTFDYTWFGEDPCCRPEIGRLPVDLDVVLLPLPAPVTAR